MNYNSAKQLISEDISLLTVLDKKIESFNNDELIRLLERKEIVALLSLINPKVTNILGANNLTFNVYESNIKNIEKSHISRVSRISVEIAKKMEISGEERTLLQQGAMLHDYGKILIPSALLEKENKLSKKEKEIISLHSDLGYELLSSTSLDKRVLMMIKNHHKPMSNNPDILGQIITVADIFAALTEKRVYKITYNKEDAFDALEVYSAQGIVNKDIVRALRNI